MRPRFSGCQLSDRGGNLVSAGKSVVSQKSFSWGCLPSDIRYNWGMTGNDTNTKGNQMNATTLQDELQTCIRLLRCYERAERDRGNTHQADGIGRHIDRICAVSLHAKGVREVQPDVFTAGGLFDYRYHELADGTKQHLRSLVAAQ